MEATSDKVKRWRENTKARMVEAMGGKCQCCGYSKSNKALGFHHINPNEKDMGFGETRAHPKKWTKIVEELRKCILVCGNCHAEIHAGVTKVPKKYAKFDEKFLDYRSIGKYDQCPVCKGQKPVQNRFCSHKCAQTNSRKVDWDKNDVLLMMSHHTISELERKLNVSNAAIYKQRDKKLKEWHKMKVIKYPTKLTELEKSFIIAAYKKKYGKDILIIDGQV